MPKFGNASKSRLAECDPRLQEICHEVIKFYDFTVLCGHRGEEEQNKLFKDGQSKLKFPNSKHNKNPSLAVDIAPWPIDWNDHRRFHLLSGMMFSVANAKGITLRWGGDWNRNWDLNDQSFYDLPHFEIVE